MDPGARPNTYSVFVGHLLPSVSKNELFDVFKTCGTIFDIFILPADQSAYTYGFVRYEDKMASIKATQELNKWPIQGTPMIVDLSKETRIKLENEGVLEVSDECLSTSNQDVRSKARESNSNYIDDVINLSRLNECCSNVNAQASESGGQRLINTDKLLHDISETNCGTINSNKPELIDYQPIDLQNLSKKLLNQEMGKMNQDLTEQDTKEFFLALDVIMDSITGFTTFCQRLSLEQKLRDSTAEEMKAEETPLDPAQVKAQQFEDGLKKILFATKNTNVSVELTEDSCKPNVEEHEKLHSTQLSSQSQEASSDIEQGNQSYFRAERISTSGNVDLGLDLDKDLNRSDLKNLQHTHQLKPTTKLKGKNKNTSLKDLLDKKTPTSVFSSENAAFSDSSLSSGNASRTELRPYMKDETSVRKSISPISSLKTLGTHTSNKGTLRQNDCETFSLSNMTTLKALGHQQLPQHMPMDVERKDTYSESKITSLKALSLDDSFSTDGTSLNSIVTSSTNNSESNCMRSNRSKSNQHNGILGPLPKEETAQNHKTKQTGILGPIPVPNGILGHGPKQNSNQNGVVPSQINSKQNSILGQASKHNSSRQKDGILGPIPHHRNSKDKKSNLSLNDTSSPSLKNLRPNETSATMDSWIIGQSSRSSTFSPNEHFDSSVSPIQSLKQLQASNEIKLAGRGSGLMDINNHEPGNRRLSTSSLSSLTSLKSPQNGDNSSAAIKNLLGVGRGRGYVLK